MDPNAPLRTRKVRLHHAGYVVADIAASVHGFQRSLDAEWDERIFHDPIQKVKVTFLSTSDSDAQVELVEPADPASPVAAFLSRGGGLHHLCYEVADLEAHLTAMRARRATIVRKPQPAVAFNGRRIAWVLTAEKLLVEYLEMSRG